jgi:hypothetical protein
MADLERSMRTHQKLELLGKKLDEGTLILNDKVVEYQAANEKEDKEVMSQITYLQQVKRV